jgi:Fur family transcriptional regulator, iron response regulator
MQSVTQRTTQTSSPAARPFTQTLAKLRAAGLRPTRQRMALAKLLFDRAEPRHITAEQLYAESAAAGVQVSLATVYNALHQFTDAGLLQEVVLNPGQTYFDSNTTPHHHLMVGDRLEDVVDVDSTTIDFAKLPRLPRGMEIESIHVVIRARPQRAANANAPD